MTYHGQQTAAQPPIVEFRVVSDHMEQLKIQLPERQTDMAAGLDVRACIPVRVIIPPGGVRLIPLGFAMHINSPDFAAFIFPRSGKAHRDGLILGNTVGVIDGDYQKECYLSCWNRNAPAWPGTTPDIDGNAVIIQPGERVAQLVFLPIARPIMRVVEEFTTQTDRGGFGSTGRM